MRFWPFASQSAGPSEAEIREFRALCERASTALAKCGITRQPYDDPGMLHFRKNPRFQRALENHRIYVEVLEEFVSSGDPVGDGRKFLWRMINRMGYVPTADLFDHITDDDVIEIYTLDNWQIFRNLNFFNYISFNIEEVANLNWSADSKRESRFELKLLEIGVRLKLGLQKTTADVTSIAEHTFKELKGQGWTVAIQMRRISPLWQGSRITAGVVSNRARVVDFGEARGHGQKKADE